jgi:hypothetical protein
MKRCLHIVWLVIPAILAGCGSVYEGVTKTADAVSWTGNTLMTVGGATSNGINHAREMLTPKKFIPTSEDIENSKEFARDVFYGSMTVRRVYAGYGGTINIFSVISGDNESVQFKIEKLETDGSKSYAYLGVAKRDLKMHDMTAAAQTKTQEGN